VYKNVPFLGHPVLSHTFKTKNYLVGNLHQKHYKLYEFNRQNCIICTNSFFIIFIYHYSSLVNQLSVNNVRRFHLSLNVAMQNRTFYMRHYHSHDIIPIPIPISSPKAIPIPMGFPRESHSHVNSHLLLHKRVTVRH